MFEDILVKEKKKWWKEIDDEIIEITLDYLFEPLNDDIINGIYERINKVFRNHQEACLDDMSISVNGKTDRWLSVHVIFHKAGEEDKQLANDYVVTVT